MSKKLTQQIEEALAQGISDLGYELCDVEYKNEDGNMVLTIFIDSVNGVSMDDCVYVNDYVNPLLDKLDPIQAPYYLSVSSLGLDRPFKRDRDFQRYLGKDIEIRLYAPINKKKAFIGKLIGYENDIITIENNGVHLKFDKKEVALARPHIEF